jgi:hypothetical protein
MSKSKALAAPEPTMINDNNLSRAWLLRRAQTVAFAEYRLRRLPRTRCYYAPKEF